MPDKSRRRWWAQFVNDGGPEKSCTYRAQDLQVGPTSYPHILHSVKRERYETPCRVALSPFWAWANTGTTADLSAGTTYQTSFLRLPLAFLVSCAIVALYHRHVISAYYLSLRVSNLFVVLVSGLRELRTSNSEEPYWTSHGPTCFFGAFDQIWWELVVVSDGLTVPRSPPTLYRMLPFYHIRNHPREEHSEGCLADEY